MKGRSVSGGLVYSTGSGRMCPLCRQAVADCRCKAQSGPAPGASGAAGPVKVWRESKGRGGKTVTLVKGLALAPDALDALGKQLKAQCGSGGTVKEGVIEIQGDHAERLVAALTAKGIKAKRAGG